MVWLIGLVSLARLGLVRLVGLVGLVGRVLSDPIQVSWPHWFVRIGSFSCLAGSLGLICSVRRAGLGWLVDLV